MTMRRWMMIGAVAGLAACQPTVPDSGAGLYAPSAREAREAQLTTPIVPNAPSVTGQPLSAMNTPLLPDEPRSARAVTDPQSLDAELAAGATEAGLNSGEPVLNASPTNAAPLVLDNPVISDENSFDAASGRGTIASDAARVQPNREQYQVVQPTELLQRPDGVQPNVVQYALETTHPKGTKVYTRRGGGSAERNCARYASADEAQIDFLASGGPEQDRRGLDPDGDGYACAWDPAPFRTGPGN